jgi:hypothetical protein
MHEINFGNAGGYPYRGTDKNDDPYFLPFLFFDCGWRMRDNIDDDLNNKKAEQDDPACQGIIFPHHYHKSIIHRDVEGDIWHQLFPIHFLSERNFQYPVIQSLDRQKCQKDSQKDRVPGCLLFLLDQENRVDGWYRQKEIYPSNPSQKKQMILAN